MVEQAKKMLNIVGIIHARGGSKRIPLKNIKPLNGKPLVSYIIEAALKSRYLRRVLVSTDHPEIKKISIGCGAQVPFVRPAHLSDDCPSELVTQHAVEFIENEENSRIDIAVTLQPTTPFCQSSDIDACISILLSDEAIDSVFSARQVLERPEWMFIEEAGHHASIMMHGPLRGDRGVCQSLPRLVIPNGAAYATRRSALFNEGLIISPNTGVYVMPPERSVDIDEPLDFVFAEFLAKQKEVENEKTS